MTSHPKEDLPDVTEDWAIYRGVAKGVSARMFEVLDPLCRRHDQDTRFGTFVSKRRSCYFHTPEITPVAGSSLFSYENLDGYEWIPEITHLTNFIEENFGDASDYVLAHIYDDGTDNINPHNDKEAWSTPVYSFSFGATRKFRFQRIGDKSGYSKEFHLEDGDLLVMRAGCQQRWKHFVPVEKRVKDKRINITIRQKDGSYKMRFKRKDTDSP